MGDLFSNTGQTPFNDELINYMTIGSFLGVDGATPNEQLVKPLALSEGDDNHFGRAVKSALIEETNGGDLEYEYPDHRHKVNTFSLIQSTIRAYAGFAGRNFGTYSSSANFNHDHELAVTSKYLQGPFSVAASEILRSYGGLCPDGSMENVAQSLNPQPITDSNHWEALFQAAWKTRPRTTERLDGEAFYRFELDESKVDTGGVYKAFMDVANQAVVDQFALIYTGQSPPFSTAWAQITETPTANDQYTAYNPSLTAPQSSSIASQQSIDEPTPASVGAAPTIDAPTPVVIEDNIDDAVDAFSAQAELRYAADEAKLRATFFGGRAVMSTFFDVALAQLSAHKNAQIADYDKSLRVEQTRQQKEVDTTYQQMLLDQQAKQAGIDTDYERLGLEASLKNAEQLILAQSKNREFEVEFQKINLQEYLGYLEALSKHNSLAAEVARIAQEFVFKKRDENYQYWATEVKQKIEVLACLYQSFVAFAGGNNSAAGVLAQLLQIDFKESVYRRDQELAWKQYNMQMAQQMAQALHAFTEYKWKAQIQDLMVIKEAMSILSGVNAGTENHMSPFEKGMQITSGLLGAVSSVANLGMILGG